MILCANCFYCDSLFYACIAYTRDRLGNVLSAVAEGVSTNLYAYSREGLLTNEVQNGVVLSRPHDALGRPLGYVCRSADEEVETPSSPEPGDQITRLSAQVGTGAEGIRDKPSPLPALSPSAREAVSTASGLRRDSGFSPRSGQAVHQGGGAPYGVEYTYDAYGRLSAVSLEEGGASPPVEPFSFTYDYLPGTDLVSGYASGDFFRSVSYEPDRDLVASVENSFGDAVVSRFDYTNDALGRRVARVDSGAAFAETAFERYAYNDRSEVVGSQRYYGNNVNAFSRPMTGRSFGYGYDPIGNRVTSYEDVGGFRLTTGYEANELNEYTVMESAGAVPLRGEAERGAAVKVNGGAAERDSGNAAVTPWSFALATGPRGEAGFQYADILATVSGEGGTNVVSSVSGEVFAPADETHLSYDADGNMTSDGRWTYTWNGENRLIRAVEAVHPTNRAPRVVEYAYDHRGRMVWKTIGGTNAPPDTALAYLWDDYNIVRETLVTRTSSLVTDNVWGLDLDGTTQGCGGVGGLLAVVEDGEVYTPTYDANGNISEYVDSSGTIIAHQEYDPFGSAIVSSGDDAAFTHWFSTKPWCGVTGMVEYQYRKYRPGIGRWGSRDSLPETTSLTMFSYVDNNPVNCVDIIGLMAELVNDSDTDVLAIGNVSISEDCRNYINEVTKAGLERAGINNVLFIIPAHSTSAQDSTISDVDGYWTAGKDSETGHAVKIRNGIFFRSHKIDNSDISTKSGKTFHDLFFAKGDTRDFQQWASTGLKAIYLNNAVACLLECEKTPPPEGQSQECDCTQKDVDNIKHAIDVTVNAAKEFPHAK